MFDKKLFKNIMAQSASAVYIITVNGKKGKFGLTINSVSSVTDDPAMILFCINKNASIYKYIEHGNIICINVLSYKQQDLAQEFAGVGQTNRENRFQKNSFKLTGNNQIIFEESLAFLEGSVEDSVVKGSHVVFFLKIIDGMILNNNNALIYFNRNFKKLT